MVARLEQNKKGCASAGRPPKKLQPFSVRFLFFKLKILPLAVVDSVDFFCGQEEFFYDVVFRVEFHELAVHESVEAAHVGAHAVSRQVAAGDVEGEGFVALGACISQSAAVQPQLSCA